MRNIKHCFNKKNIIDDLCIIYNNKDFFLSLLEILNQLYKELDNYRYNESNDNLIIQNEILEMLEIYKKNINLNYINFDQNTKDIQIINIDMLINLFKKQYKKRLIVYYQYLIDIFNLIPKIIK
jgi:hypothetical protein